MATIKTQTAPANDANGASLTPPQQLRANWSLKPDAPILPEYFHINEFPPDLFAAVLELSYLTINQSDRAWNLLNTYFSARIREASYTGRQQSIYAMLQVEDVEKAIESTKRMRRGQELQAKALEVTAETNPYGHWQSRTSMNRREAMEREVQEAAAEAGKRKYSIRHEISSEGDEKNEREAKKPKLEIKIIPVSKEKEDDGFPSPPLETRLLTPTPTRPSHNLSPLTPLLQPSVSPIQRPQSSSSTANRSHSTTPSPPSHTSPPTPTSNKTPAPRPKPLRLQARPPPLSLTLQIPPTPLPAHFSAYRQSYNNFIDAARQATHQANLLRREAEMLEERARAVREMGRGEERKARGLRERAGEVGGFESYGEGEGWGWGEQMNLGWG
ncbi:hypothetical protein BKA63DRAFT_606262 [Paraphoma chrysanthemicola]|nr:hypothetical protein BKA63DRAFT_606262 [Paraphoma chrysanthemicola]